MPAADRPRQRSRDLARRGAALAATFLLALSPPPSSNAAAAPQRGFRLAQWPARAPSPDFSLVDDSGHLRTLADYRGHVVVVFFGFLRCPDVCPTELFKLALAHRRLSVTPQLVQVLFITLDPEHDTAQALGPYVRAFDPSFIGLTGTAAQIDSAALRFHVRYARVPLDDEYTIDHSTGTYVFDRAGRLRLIATPASGVDDLVHDLTVLATDRVRQPRG
jgi:protein SCO1/2